jgi:hypothetical protein
VRPAVLLERALRLLLQLLDALGLGQAAGIWNEGRVTR